MPKRSAFYSQGESLVQQDGINTLTEKLAYMKIINMRDPRLSLYIFNLVMGRKQTTIVAILCSVILSVFIIGYSYAGTWRDKFDGNKLNGWERIVEENPWFADWRLVKGALFSDIVNRPPDQFTIADFLHWNAHQFELNRITVEGEEINYKPHGHDRFESGQFCLFLGKRGTAPEFAEGYIFSPEEITTMWFSVKGDYKKGNSKAKYGLMWRLTRGHLKVVFDTGRFRLFAQDILVAEFSDANINVIDVVGLLILCDVDADWFEANISTFSVFGRDIPNHNSLDVQLRNTQLTTTWGKLKRF